MAYGGVSIGIEISKRHHEAATASNSVWRTAAWRLETKGMAAKNENNGDIKWRKQNEKWHQAAAMAAAK